MMIDAGKLDRKLQLLSLSPGRDEFGQPQNTWTVVATLWGQRLTLSQADIARKPGSSENAEVVRRSVRIGKYLIRWRADITDTMRVRIDGLDYAITGIDEPDRRQSLTLTVEGVL